MNIMDLWKDGNKPSFSVELFPARSDKGGKTLNSVIEKLLILKPDFVSVTFGAGGSSRDGSFELIKKLMKLNDNKVLPYIASYGLSASDLDNVLNEYKEIGVKNILCVRGDKPEDNELFPHPDGFNFASDFIRHINENHQIYIGAAGYPEGHIDSNSKETDWEYLKLKVKNGAKFIIANYFFDNRYFYEFKDKCRELGINVPIIAGIMPIYSVKMLKILSAKCGATITDEIKMGLKNIDLNEKKEVIDFGIEYAAKQCKDLLENKVDGLHFYTMNKSKSVLGIFEKLNKRGFLLKS